jgi:CubicO group peptidase (beta-lactamase class C family)
MNGDSMWQQHSTALRFLLAQSVLLLSACASAPVETTPAPVRRDLSFRLDSIVESALANGAAPGAALVVGRQSQVIHMRAYGRIDTARAAPAITDSTLFDLASLTKVIGTTTAAMILEEEGKLDLNRAVRDYLPEFNAPDKAGITVRHLLAHNGGFVAGSALWRDERGPDAYVSIMNERALAYATGDSTIYSDWDLILTGKIVERITGKTLDVFLEERVWTPLGMRDTGFNPLASEPLNPTARCIIAFRPNHPLLPRIAATELDTVYRKALVHGVVHDENACSMGGVAGHAGLFSSARDLSIFAQMMLNGGEVNGVRILQAATIARWTARQSPRSSRALGWDTPAPGSSAGRFMSPRSFGHTGFTGTSIWMDAERGIYVILLTNRVNPTRANTKHEPLRRAVADAVGDADHHPNLPRWPLQPFQAMNPAGRPGGRLPAKQWSPTCSESGRYERGGDPHAEPIR